ncbi:MAG: ATP-dependent DNA helicase [bacterium]
MNNPLAGLTPDQAKAVTHKDGPCLVVAGAGTGKTSVITKRIANLILNEKVEPEQILALTFTDKAAGEMEERLDVLLPYGMFGTTIGTFHSFCRELVRRHAFTIGIDPNARLIGKAEEVSLLRANLLHLPLKRYKPAANPVSFLRQLAGFIDRAKEERITPELLAEHGSEIMAAAENDADKEAGERILELSECYEAANRLYAEANILTYADLISFSLRILQESALARKEEQDRFRYVLIDEFQDTNTAQAEICYLLAGERENIFVVGDDDQAIYRFRGANVDNIIMFRARYPKAPVVTLRDNFRSTQPILDAAYSLIQHNNPHRLEVIEKIDKQLIAHSEAEPAAVESLHFSAGSYEQEGVALRIQALLDIGYESQDIAILARGHAQLDPFERELSSWGIQTLRHKDGSFYSLPTVERALSYLRFLVSPHDSFNLFFLLSEPPFAVETVLLRELSVSARKINNSLWEELGSSSVELPEDAAEAFRYLGQKLTSKVRTPTDALRDFIGTSGWEKQLTEADDRDAFAALNTLYAEAGSFERLHKPVVLSQYLLHVDQLIASGEDIKVESELGKEKEGVQLMTIHGSKGLEFKAVFVVNMTSDRFPGPNRSGGLPLPEELVTLQEDKVKYEEERRLAYVAMTRAKERLFLTHSQRYEGNKREKKLSPFLSEALGPQDEKNYADQPLRLGLSQADTSEKAPQFSIPTTYSASALEAFEESPERYLIEQVYRLPQPDSSYSSFGTCVHEVLHAAFGAIRSGKPLTDGQIVEQYEKCWRAEGFEHKLQEEEWRQEGLAAIQGYLSSHDGDYVPDRLEHPIELVLPSGIRIIGKVDRIDKLSDGSVKVIDYKTGRKTATHADIKKNLPLAVYAAALSQRREQVGSVSLHYLMNGETVDLPVDEAFLAQTIERVSDIVSRIEDAYKTNTWPSVKTYFN